MGIWLGKKDGGRYEKINNKRLELFRPFLYIVYMKGLEMTLCTKCGGEMPLLRFTQYGYRQCVKCSSVEKVGGVPITNHKTGNSIQIVPMEVANNIIRLAARSGYGVCKGMKHN